MKSVSKMINTVRKMMRTVSKTDNETVDYVDFPRVISQKECKTILTYVKLLEDELKSIEDRMEPINQNMIEQWNIVCPEEEMVDEHFLTTILECEL